MQGSPDASRVIHARRVARVRYSDGLKCGVLRAERGTGRFFCGYRVAALETFC